MSWSARAAFPMLVAALAALGISLRLANLGNVAGRSPDERVYMHQARMVAAAGLTAGTRALVHRYNHDREQWIYPPPNRIGYHGLLGGIVRLSGRSDESTAARISFAASTLSLLVVAAIGIRFLTPAMTLFALLFMAVSPMDLAISRRVWQDSLFGFLGLSMVYSVMAIVNTPRRMLPYVILTVAGCFITLVKEPGPFVYGLCTLWACWDLAFRQRALARSSILMAVSAASLVSSYAIMSHAVGGVGTLLNIFGHIREAMPTNTYAIEYQSGPWMAFLATVWALSPTASSLFVFGLVGTLLPLSAIPDEHKARRPLLIGLILFSLAFFSLTLLVPYCQNLRYVSVVYGPFYLIAGAGMGYAVPWLGRLRKGGSTLVIAVVVSALMFAAIRDYRMFEKVFIHAGATDLSVRMLRECSK